MDIERNINNMRTHSLNKFFHVIRISFFHNSLAEIVAKLINHDITNDWSNRMNEALGKSNPFRRLWLNFTFQSSRFLSAWAFRYLVLNHLLKHSASSLIEAVVIESVENIFLLSAELRKKGCHLLVNGGLGRLESLSLGTHVWNLFL